MLRVLLSQITGNGTAYVFDSSALELYSWQDREGIVYVQDEDDLEDFEVQLKNLCEDRRLRYKRELEKNSALTPAAYYGSEEPVYVVADDIDKFIADGSTLEGELCDLLKDAAECGVGVIITVHSTKHKGADPVSKWVKGAAHGLVLSPQGILNIFPVRTQREYPPMGRGLLFHNGGYVTVQLPEGK